MRLTILYAMFSFVATAALVATTMQSVAVAGEAQVGYRLTAWKTMHFDDAKKGDAHHKAVRDLGCEVKKENHGGHIDVSYGCNEWKRMTVASHDAAHQWEKWLKAAGFETKHAH